MKGMKVPVSLWLNKPCPEYIPEDVWQSHQDFYLFKGSAQDRKEKWALHYRLLRSYVQDANFHFLRDESGGFLRKDPDDVCSFPHCACNLRIRCTPLTITTNPINVMS